MKHWCVTEKGHTNTRRIHLHGLFCAREGQTKWQLTKLLYERFRYVEVECGHCFECRKKKRREWRIRNYEQLKETPHAVFFTGTVSPQRYEYICKKYDFKNDGSQDNEIITKIHRLFLERIRKETGKSVSIGA